MKKLFLKPSKTEIESLEDFYESTGFMHSLKQDKWNKNLAPQYFKSYYKFTSNLLLRIHYGCTLKDYGTTPSPKLDSITVAFRDGKTEYSLIKKKLLDLKELQKQHKRSKPLARKIEWLEFLNRNIRRILPKFTKPFTFNTGKKDCSQSITIDDSMVSKSDISSKYVVLDLETNGLRTANDDLLSISLYDPATGKIYNRYLPLELQPTVLTTYIHGIDDDNIKDEVPLCQEEFDNLIKEFNLNNKIILFYSGGKFDYTFLDKYCKRHKISGMEFLKFENIKDKIAASSYLPGTLSKDNLCRALGIEGVSKMHSGVNDCILEWKLFEQFACNKLLIKNNFIYQFSDEYIVPSSYLTTFPKLAELAQISIPKLKYTNLLLYEYNLPSCLIKKIKKFPTNISGISIENMINNLVGAIECDNATFLKGNNSKLKIVGKLPSPYNEIPITKSQDGTLKSLDPQYEEYIKSVNEVSSIIRSGISPVIEYIKEKIFYGKEIRTQEITISENNKVLALCDLSTDDAVLEIKTFDIFNSYKTENVIQQMYYQKGTKDLYSLSIIYDYCFTNKSKLKLENLIFKIHKVEIEKIEE